MDSYQSRLIDPKIRNLMESFSTVMINGARAVGKTTTGREHATEIAQLDIPGTAAAFRADPDAALHRYGRPLLIDEWQEVPEVMGAIKRAVDIDSTPGQFLLTGSNDASIRDKTWPGTGRIVREKMFGLTQKEIHNPTRIGKPGVIEKIISGSIGDIKIPKELPSINEYVETALQSGFPHLNFVKTNRENRKIWLQNYVNELVTRDVSSIGERRDSEKIRKYLIANAIQSATTVSDNTLYDAVKINSKTAAQYDEILINLNILEMLPSWSGNLLKNLALNSKRYLLDTGIMTNAANLDLDSIINDDKLLGNLFDTFALMQIRPEVSGMLEQVKLSHLRTGGGRHEIDLIIQLENSTLIACEFKAGSSPTISDAKHLVWLKEEVGKRFIAGLVLHSGSSIYQLEDRVYALPLSSFWG